MTIAFQVMMFMILAVAVVSLNATTNHVGSMKDEIKCGACPCGMTCYTSPPPPPPSPPPKKPSPTPGLNCPPPPKCCGGGSGSGQAPPDYSNIVGPPKDLYPVFQTFSAARGSFMVAPRLLVLSGLLGILALW